MDRPFRRLSTACRRGQAPWPAREFPKKIRARARSGPLRRLPLGVGSGLIRPVDVLEGRWSNPQLSINPQEPGFAAPKSAVSPRGPEEHRRQHDRSEDAAR